MIDLSFEGSPDELMEFIGREICEDCYDLGIVYFMESDGEGHYASTGVKTCHCRMVDWNDRTEDQ